MNLCDFCEISVYFISLGIFLKLKLINLRIINKMQPHNRTETEEESELAAEPVHEA
jgi:hypothetical protein